MRYGEAVKKYFADRGESVHFPKKDSEHYKAIRALMASGDVTGDSAVSAAAAPLEKKARRVSKKKEVAAKAPGAPQDTPTKAGGHTTLIDQPHVTKQAEAAVVDAPEKPPVKKRKPRAVKADGETPQQNLLTANAVDNGSMHVVPAAYPGLKGQIEKVLEVKPEGIPERKEMKMKPEILTSKTTEGKRTDDRPALSGRAPFSFQAVRHLLRQ